jgi:polysaccharide biosynthesis/export protein
MAMTLAPGRILCVLLLAGVLGCAGNPVPPEFSDAAIEEAAYRIGTSDILTIRVWKNEDLSVEAPVLPDGTVSVPLVGAVAASGLTTGELEDAIAQPLNEYVTAPEVSVTVMQAASRRVSVMGEVQRPGWVPVTSTTRVVDAISNAGGFTQFASRRKVRVIRHLPDRDVTYVFNYSAYAAGRGPDTNVRLESGDVVIVPD